MRDRVKEQGITTLIKSAITGKGYSLPIGFDLTGALPFCTAHHITPLVYTGAKLCGLQLTDQTDREFLTATAQIISHCERQLIELEDIYTAFSDNNIGYIPLKGAFLKSLYPLSHLRPMGDADILIKHSDYPLITRIMKNLGYNNTAQTDHDYSWAQPGFTRLELHLRLFDPSFEYYNQSDGVWDMARPDPSFPNRHCFSPEDNFVYLFAHFTKHYSKAGVGIKHVTDLFIMLRTYDLDFNYIYSRLATIGLIDFYHHIHRLLLVWFEDESWDEVSASITDFIFSSHAFGSIETMTVSTIAGRASDGTGIAKAKFRTFLRKGFPSLNNMRVRYKALDKAPFLLPIYWVIRFFDILFNRGYRFRQLASETKYASQDRVTVRINHLKSVGLYKD